MSEKLQKSEKTKPRFSKRYILPNAITLLSLCCGLYSIISAMQAEGSGVHLTRACISIFFACLFDLFDGRVARMTNAQSEFGVQMDSLCDAVSFGVAPGILIYIWALQDFGFIGMICTFLYVSCGILRLAKFNVMASDDSGNPDYFSGLPIPAAAGGIFWLVLSVSRTWPNMNDPTPFLLLYVTLIALAMISPFPFPTFKRWKLSRETMPSLVGLVVAWLIVWALTRLSTAFLGLFIVYVGLGFRAFLRRQSKQVLPLQSEG